MTFGEALIDRRQQFMSLAVATLTLPKPRQ
jgi:hypothetical protein